jgi:hypothetical protein
MKKYKFLSAALALVMTAAMLLTGCSGKNGGSSSGSEDAAADLTGIYLLDSTALGMPLQVYLIIKDDDTFQWTNRRENGDDKGHGTVGRNDGTYLLLYSDSTADVPKTATFTVEGGNLHFSTRVPYGTSGFSPNTEDESNIIYPEAKKLVFEEYIGEYVGKSGDYEYSLQLSYGAQYVITSTGKDDTYTASGLFDVKDGKLTLTPESGTAVEAAIGTDKTVTISKAKLNQAGATAEIKLDKATTAVYAGSYIAPGNITLTLDKLGGYVYQSGGYSESGKFTAEDENVFFTAADGAKRTGTVGAYIARVAFPKAAGGAVTEFTAYESVIQGNLSAEEEVEADGENETPPGKYTAGLTLTPDGKYTVSIGKDGQTVRTERGTFSTATGTVGITLDLTSENNDISSGIIAGQTVNFRLVVDEALNEVGFQFAKR